MTVVRRLATAVAGVVAGAVALSGCLYSVIPPEAPRPTSTFAPDTDGVSDDLQRYYGQELAWSDCGGGFDCATVTAPLDWTDVSAGDISLAIIRHHAGSGQPLGSLLVNQGGPGASGVDFVRGSLDFAVGESLSGAYDVVGFDPRGVGRSTAVTCLDAAGLDAYLFTVPANPRGSDAWAAELAERNTTFADACEANSDGILPFVTTVNAAKDLDLLRGVLGDRQLNYLGYSYGTFLGATYAGLFPEKVGRVVLDGGLDPAVPGWQIGAVQAKGFESALRAYMTDCLASEDCPFRGTIDQAMADLATLLASVDASPLEAADGRRMNADSLFTAIVTALYSQDNWPVLTQALAEVLQGDANTAFLLADVYYNRVDGAYLDNSTEAFRAYNCMDYPSDDPAADQASAAALVTETAPTIAPYWNSPDPCAVWPYPATGERGAIAADGAAPILVIGTTNDPATPYEWSVALAGELSSGILITRVGEGHTGYNKGNACVDDAVHAYFLDDTVPGADLTCE